MSYNYSTQKAGLLTDEGSAKFIACRDAVLSLMQKTGAMRAGCVFKCWPSGGDTWLMMAALDRMVELGDVRYVTGPNERAWQNQVVELGAEPGRLE